jgi:hypothetical protein
MELEVKNWPRAGDPMEMVDRTKSTVGRKQLVEALNALGGKGWEAAYFETMQGAGTTRVFLRKPRG